MTLSAAITSSIWNSADWPYRFLYAGWLECNIEEKLLRVIYPLARMAEIYETVGLGMIIGASASFPEWSRNEIFLDPTRKYSQLALP
jgi:hypothetical protein